jgi:septation ring formation regulator EzrA
VSEFKTIYSTRIDDVNERLKRMEKYFDKMQVSILEKVGEYGKGLNSIKKEMNMIEDSFSKVMKSK